MDDDDLWALADVPLPGPPTLVPCFEPAESVEVPGRGVRQGALGGPSLGPREAEQREGEAEERVEQMERGTRDSELQLPQPDPRLPPAREGMRWTAGPQLSLQGFRGPPAPFGPQLPRERVEGVTGPVHRAPTLVARRTVSPPRSWHPQQALLADAVWRGLDPVPDPDSPEWTLRYASAYYASVTLVRMDGDRGPPGTHNAFQHPNLVAEWLEKTRRWCEHPDKTPPDVLAYDRELIQWINDANIRTRVRELKQQYFARYPRTGRTEMVGQVRKLLWAPSAWHPDEILAYLTTHGLPVHEFVLQLRTDKYGPCY